MIDGWHELDTHELRSKSKLSRSWAVQIILTVLSTRQRALKYIKKKNQTSMLTFMWSTPKEVNTQNLFMMQHWNIAAFEMTTQRHLYFLVPPPREAGDLVLMVTFQTHRCVWYRQHLRKFKVKQHHNCTDLRLKIWLASAGFPAEMHNLSTTSDVHQVLRGRIVCLTEHSQNMVKFVYINMWSCFQ